MPYEVQRRDEHLEVAVVACLEFHIVLVHEQVQAEALNLQVYKVVSLLRVFDVAGVQLHHKHSYDGGELRLLNDHLFHYLDGVEALRLELIEYGLLLHFS